MAGESKQTIDHDEIRSWVEKRGGRPSTVKGTGNGEAGVLRIDFPRYGDEDSLEEISWDEFFENSTGRNWRFFIKRRPKTAAKVAFSSW